MPLPDKESESQSPTGLSSEAMYHEVRQSQSLLLSSLQELSLELKSFKKDMEETQECCIRLATMIAEVEIEMREDQDDETGMIS